MDRLKEKQQIEQDKQRLIMNIQSKLQQLRNQRKKLEEQQQLQKLNHNQYTGSDNQITNQKQHKSFERSAPSVIINNKPAQKYPIQTSQQTNDPNEQYHNYLRQKANQKQAKQKLKYLQQIYAKKKLLQSIGMIPSSNSQVQRLFKDTKVQKKLQQFDPNAKQQKQKILKQQMQRIAFMLKKKKVNRKQIQQMKQHYYQNLLKDKTQQLQRYQTLLYHSKRLLSLVQKQQIIDIVFQNVRQFTGRVKKSVIKDFLLANQKFCSVFYITQEQIFNDLQVYQTQERDELSRNQFYQFVKSIEITNPMLNPSIKNDKIINKKIQRENKSSKNITSSRVSTSKINKQNENESKKQSQMKSYLIKLFQYFDQKQQKLVQRQKYVIALKKALVLDKKLNLITKQYTQKFGLYLQKIRQNKNKKSYFMKLQSKFIAWSQIQDYYESFFKDLKNQNQIPVKNQQNNTQNQSNLSSADQQIINQTIEFLIQKQQNKQQSLSTNKQQKIQEGKLQDYFREYGWQQTGHRQQSVPLNSYPSKLSQFDNYYKQMSQKHANQIQWNNNIRDKLSLQNNTQFKQDFNKLQCYIKGFQQKKKQRL